MKRFSFYQVDAFTKAPLTGNACAVVLDTGVLPDPSFVAIAREFNLAETAFVTKIDHNHIWVRYFTPAEEIPLAGHPTIATAYILAESGRISLRQGHNSVWFHLKAGRVKVEIIAGDEERLFIWMTQKRPQFLSVHDPERVANLFGLSASDLLPNCPVQTVSTGTPQLMVAVKNIEALRRATLNIEAYQQYRAASDFFSPHLFCLAKVVPGATTFARHFGTPPDLMEDPFTGSATGGMAAFLWRYHCINQPEFVAAQGHFMGRPGLAEVALVGTPQDIEAVKVGGSAVTTMRGEIFLP